MSRGRQSPGRPAGGAPGLGTGRGSVRPGDTVSVGDNFWRGVVAAQQRALHAAGCALDGGGEFRRRVFYQDF